VIFDLTANKVAGDPDGMTIDKNGNLWVACFNSNHVSVVRPAMLIFKTFYFYIFGTLRVARAYKNYNFFFRS